MHLVRNPAYRPESAVSRPARVRAYAPLPLRFALGIGFMIHGFPKLGASGHEAFALFLGSIGVPLPSFSAWVVALTEALGGAALLAGVFTGIAAVLLIFEMLVALILPHGADVSVLSNHPPAVPLVGRSATELSLLYLAGLVSLVVTGPGRMALQSGVSALRRRWRVRQIREWKPR